MGKVGWFMFGMFLMATVLCIGLTLIAKSAPDSEIISTEIHKVVPSNTKGI